MEYPLVLCRLQGVWGGVAEVGSEEPCLMWLCGLGGLDLGRPLRALKSPRTASLTLAQALRGWGVGGTLGHHGQ